MKKSFVILLGLLFLCTSCSGETRSNKEKIIKEVSPQARITKFMEDLTNEEMAGRRTGTRGEAKAAFYLARYLKTLGIKPAGEENTYFQSFPVGEITTVQIEKRMTLRHTSQSKIKTYGENILGIIPGKSDEIVVVSAHYDHLGIVDKALYTGANDNASGTAVLLELASFFAQNTPRYTLLVAFWGGEEAGLLGSNYYVNNFTVPQEKINCIVNLDSLGNLHEDMKLLGWKSCDNSFSSGIIEGLKKAGWEVEWEVTTRHNSDHWAFAKKGMAGFTLLSPSWLENNHTPEDTMDRINIEILTKFMDDIRSTLS